LSQYRLATMLKHYYAEYGRIMLKKVGVYTQLVGASNELLE